MFIQFVNRYAWAWAYLALRLVVGVIFIAHGWPKIKSLKTNAEHFEAMGFRPGNFWGTIVAVVETVGGLALIVGLYAQLAAVLIAINMFVASIWKMKRGQGLVGGYELDLVLLVSALALASVSISIYSLDLYLFSFLMLSGY